MSTLRSRAFHRGVPRALILIVCASALALVACSPTSGPATMSLAPPVLPHKADLSTPEAAVRTYLDFTSFAYRMANSDVASRAASPWEGVRVDSYIELNREKDRGIEQMLVRFDERSQSREGTRVVVSAHEEWRYRYFTLSTRRYASQMYSASYDTTYTLIKDPTGWLVDKVEAKDLSPVN